MRDEKKSQAQLVNDLQGRVAELARDNAELERQATEALLEYDDVVTEYFDLDFHAHDMVISINMETERVLQCNKALTKTLGYGREEIVGHSSLKLYHQDYIEDAKELFRLIAETGEIHDAEQTLRKRDGGKITVIGLTQTPY